MKPHPNSRTDPQSRAQLIRLVDERQWTVAEAADAMGISKRLVYRWRRRYRREGAAGLGLGMAGVRLLGGKPKPGGFV